MAHSSALPDLGTIGHATGDRKPARLPGRPIPPWYEDREVATLRAWSAKVMGAPLVGWRPPIDRSPSRRRLPFCHATICAPKQSLRTSGASTRSAGSATTTPTLRSFGAALRRATTAASDNIVTFVIFPARWLSHGRLRFRPALVSTATSPASFQGAIMAPTF